MAGVNVPDRADGPPVRDHPPPHADARIAAHDARPRPARVLPRGGRRAGRWAATSATPIRGASTASPADFNNTPARTGLGPLPPAVRGRHRRSCPRSPTPTCVQLVNGRRPSRPTASSSSAQSDVNGFFVAAGFCAHGIAGAGGNGKVMAEWIVGGEPPMDLWRMDIRRFGDAVPAAAATASPAPYEVYSHLLRHRLSEPRARRRPARCDIARLRTPSSSSSAEFGEKAGWERVNWYRSNEDPAHEHLRPRGWAGRALVDGDRHRAPGDARHRRRCSTSRASPRSRCVGPGAAALPATAVRQRRRPRRSARSPTPRC